MTDAATVGLGAAKVAAASRVAVADAITVGLVAWIDAVRLLAGKTWTAVAATVGFLADIADVIDLAGNTWIADAVIDGFCTAIAPDTEVDWTDGKTFSAARAVALRRATEMVPA